MYRIVDGNSHGLSDVGWFIDLINGPATELKDFFDPRQDIYVSRAPGRLDVMGGIADYSGSLVLQMPIAEATFAAVQKCDDDLVKVVSRPPDSVSNLMFEMDISDLRIEGDYENRRVFFANDRSIHWASYVAGVFYVLHRELGLQFDCGARVFIASSIPIGKGVSSSAALEVAVIHAVCAAFDITIAAREMALLCQKAENEVVGAPCGVMDQIASNCGSENKLISILCQPAEIEGEIEIPKGVEFWGIDSGVRHAVAGSDYTSVRIGTFMGYRIIADLAGLRFRQIGPSLVEMEDDRWHGYLANVSPSEYKELFASRVPKTIGGADFIDKYVGSTDQVTSIVPEKTYAVKAPTEHAIYESFRVSTFSEMLKGPTGPDLLALGELMFQSHISYAACGLTELRTDRIVELVREFQPEGLFGARITGGGSGGTVAILARRGSEDVVSRLSAKYADETGGQPYIFSGSSPGGAAFGYLRLENTIA